METLKGYKWHIIESDERVVLNIVQKLGISEILAKILVNRNICSVEDAQIFLNLTLKNHMLDPFLLKDMDLAVTRIAQAIDKKEKITIFADYDVDGATSAASLCRFFKSIGIEVQIYVPHRLLEGYGPNIQALKKIKDSGANLVILVDCGTVAFEQLNVAKEYKLDVIVVDHHISLTKLPEAVAVINPNRLDDDFKYKSIAAVGVTFFMIAAVRKYLRDINWFNINGVNEPNLLKLLDLVALGTVCDVMPLTGINRVFVQYGLNLIARRNNCGIDSIIKASKICTKITSTHIGYTIGPRINAGGRIGESKLGALLLSTDNKIETDNIAARLEVLNSQRRTIEIDMINEAVAQIVSHDVSYNSSIIMVFKNDWHLGILGILASRLKDMYNKPAIVASIDKKGLAKGSIRSVKGFDVGSAIFNAKAQNLLVEGGGHSMAGGFVSKAENLEKFHNFLEDNFNSTPYVKSALDKMKILNIDSIIDINALNQSLIDEINKAAPFGNGNETPKFLVKDVVLKYATTTKGNHVIAFVEDQYRQQTKKFYSVGNSYKKTLKLIAFHATTTKLGQFLLKNKGAIIDVVGIIQQQNFVDDGIEMIVDDITVKS